MSKHVTYEIIHYSSGYVILRCHPDGSCVIVDQFPDLATAEDFIGFLTQQIERQRRRRMALV